MPAMDPEATLRQLGLALVLGLLVGLQRQAAHEPVAGIRTFALITVLGTLCGSLSGAVGPWVVVAGLLGLAAMLVVGNLMRPQDGESPGITTEVSALIMFLVGVWLAVGRAEVGVVVGGTIAVLLSLKERLHTMVSRFSPEDLRITMQFVLIALVILPVLPDRTYGPFQVLNPYEIWLLVVVVVAVSLLGYAGQKMAGDSVSSLLAGALGGIVSSTATTVSYARRSAALAAGRDSAAARAAASQAAMVIMIASTVAYVRVIVVALALAPAHARGLAAPLGTMVLLMIFLSAALHVFQRGGRTTAPPPSTPRELPTAIGFGATYAAVMLGVAAASRWLDRSALYAVALVSGATDVDAISMSTSRLVEQGLFPVTVGWRMMLIASLSNLIFKALFAVALGTRALALRIAAAFGLALAGGLTLLATWP